MNFRDFKIDPPTPEQIEKASFCVPEVLGPDDKVEGFINHDTGESAVWIRHSDGSLSGQATFRGTITTTWLTR